MVHLVVPESMYGKGILQDGGHNPPGTERHCPAHQPSGIIQLLFYKPPKDDPPVNRMVAWLDGPFSHVEVGFPDGMASSIFAGEKVFMHKRTFSNPNYTAVSMCVTAQQVSDARAFCMEHASIGVEFDGVGMYMARMPRVLRTAVRTIQSTLWGSRGSPGSSGGRGAGAREKGIAESTFCSKYVTRVMQHIGLDAFESMDPDGTSPSMLYRVVSQGMVSQGSVSRGSVSRGSVSRGSIGQSSAEDLSSLEEGLMAKPASVQSIMAPPPYRVGLLSSKGVLW